MLRILKNILLFQKKIFFLSYMLSFVFGVYLLYGDAKTVGFCFLVVAPIVQYFIYEIKDKNEYYYYFNVGLSRIQLWISTIVIGFINLLILSLL